MRGLLIALVLLGALVLGVGFYRGWFTFAVNQEKFQEDKETAKDKVKKLWPKAKDKPDTTDGTKEKTGTPVDGAKEDDPGSDFGD